MHALKLTLSDEEYDQLRTLANAEGVSIQEYVKGIALNKNNIFTAKEAVKRAKELYKPGEKFELRDLYTKEELMGLSRSASGPFGKAFFVYTQEHPGIIAYVEGGREGKRACYMLLED